MALKWTTTADVTDRWIGSAIPATDTQIEKFLGDAEDTIEREFPDIQTRIDRAAGTDTTDGPAVPQSRVQKVAARMVIRHLQNPGGVRTFQEGSGPFQKSTTYGGDEPGTVYLTDADRAELGGTKTGRAFQIDTTPSDLGGGSGLPGINGWVTPSDWQAS